MATAVIYYRFSDSNQEGGYSIEAQEAECREFADKNGYQIIRVFKDLAKTATDVVAYISDASAADQAKRKQLEQSIADATNRKRRLMRVLEESETLSTEDLGPRIRELTTQINAETARLETLIRNTIPHTTKMEMADVVKTLIKDLSGIMKDERFLRNKALVSDVIDEIKIDGETVKITWRFPDRDALSVNLKDPSSGAHLGGSPGWTRTNNLPVNSRLLCH